MIFGHRPIRNRTALRVLLCALLLSCVLRGHAQTSVWSLEGLMAELAQKTPAKSKFVEKKFLKILKRPLESRGTLHFIPPNRLEKITEFPNPESLVVDGKRVTVENKRFRRAIDMDRFPAVAAFVESIRATLKGDLAGLKSVYGTELQGPRDGWQLNLIPLDKNMLAIVKRIVIAGEEARIKSIEIQESDGDHSLLTVNE